jgi:hypothetical protein
MKIVGGFGPLFGHAHEMLSIPSRYEASLTAGRNGALNLFHGLKAAGAAARTMLGPFGGRQPTVGFPNRNDEFVAKGRRAPLKLICLAALAA